MAVKRKKPVRSFVDTILRKEGARSKGRVTRSAVSELVEAFHQKGVIDLDTVYRIHDAMGRRKNFSKAEVLWIFETEMAPSRGRAKKRGLRSS